MQVFLRYRPKQAYDLTDCHEDSCRQKYIPPIHPAHVQALDPAFLTLSQSLPVRLQDFQVCTPSGGQVTLACREENGHLCFTFTDTGCGIPDEKKPHIFERFYRTDDAHTDREHFGLGLCIAKELTEKQNGSIHVVDAPVHGTCFLVRLPVS